MKRLFPVFILLALMVTVGSASAQLNLAWDDCGAAGAANKAFACAANTGTNLLYGSVVTPAGITALAGTEGVVDLVSQSATLPAWWQFSAAGSCRQTAMSVQYNTPCGSAIDYYGSIPGGALGGFGFTWGATLCVGSNCPSYGALANAGRLKTVAAVDIGAAGPVNEGDEIYVFTVRITNALTTGAGACAGCTEPVCIVFNSLKLAQQEPLPNPVLTTAATSQMVTWQGAGANCAAVPARSTTWGQIKGLYR